MALTGNSLTLRQNVLGAFINLPTAVNNKNGLVSNDEMDTNIALLYNGINSKLSLTGGTLTGALSGTSLSMSGNGSFGGNLTVTGNLTINGTTTTINSTTVSIDDPIFTLGGDTAPTVDDNKDRGIEFRWHNGTTSKLGFFGFDDSTGFFTFIPDASNTSEVFSGATGVIDALRITGSAASLTTPRTIALSGDVSGSVSFDGSTNVTITTTIQPDSVALGTDTTGNYIAIGAVAGNGLTGSANAEGATFTVTSNATSANTANTIVFRDASGNFSAGTITASLSGNATSATDANRMVSSDIRTISPSNGVLSRMIFGFTSWNNNNTAPYADYLHLRSYTDASGGNDNLVAFRKDTLGIRVWQQSFGSASPYSTFKDVAWTDGTNASGTWPINITGNAETVDGFSASQNTIGSTIVVRDPNGYIFGNYINMTDDGNPGGGTAITSFITKQGDNYYRSVSPTNAMVSIRNVASGSWNITAANVTSISGATGGSYIWTNSQNFENNGQGVGSGGQSGYLGAYSTGGNPATMNFHRAGVYAINMGLDTDNVFRLGGWSDGSNVFRFQINTAGTMTVRGDVNSTSDIRVKTNIERIEDPIGKVSKINGVYFNRTDENFDPNRRYTGVIAQEVEAVLPEAVNTTDNGIKTVSYGNMVGLLIEAIKEQQKQIDALKNEIAALRK